MDTMFRLDFSRGTVEKIDASIPPRGWQAGGGAERESPRRTGYTFEAPTTAPPATQDEE